MSKIPYSSTIESLMYTILCTWPNIAHAISITSRYQAKPEEYCTTVKYFLKYLRTKDILLIFEVELRVQGYIDSNFMSNIDDWKSTLAYVFLCNSGAELEEFQVAYHSKLHHRRWVHHHFKNCQWVILVQEIYCRAGCNAIRCHTTLLWQQWHHSPC